MSKSNKFNKRKANFQKKKKRSTKGNWGSAYSRATPSTPKEFFGNPSMSIADRKFLDQLEETMR